VNRTGVKNQSLFHRLGIALVILGMMQSLAPTCFLPTRSSLSLLGRLRIAFASPLDENPANTNTEALAWNSAPASAQQDQEADQESQDTEDLSETFAWPEAMTDRRSVPRASVATSPGPLLKPEREAVRTHAALQRMRAMPILATISANATAQLCRFTC